MKKDKEVIFKYKRDPHWTFCVSRVFQQIAEFVEKNKKYPTIIELPVYEYCLLKELLMEKKFKPPEEIFGVKEIRMSHEKQQHSFPGA